MKTETWTADEYRRFRATGVTPAKRLPAPAVQAKGKPAPRHEPGKMNRWEAQFAAMMLEPRKLCGEVDDYLFEAVKFRLGPKCFYTPDFLAVTSRGLNEVHEVKGFWRDDARVKWKWFCREYGHMFACAAWTKRNGIWIREE